MRLSRTYSSSEYGGGTTPTPEPEQEQETYLEDEYRHLNRSSDSPLSYFLKFLLVISSVLLVYMYMTGKL